MKDKDRGVSPQLNSSSNSAVTQPVGEARNVRRNQQIKALHLEFEDLKKKIKDVESKNERIIENIHKQYDFKKKPHTAEYMPETSPIVHYEHPKPTLPDNSADLSDPDTKPRLKKQSNIIRNKPSFHQSIQYRKTEHLPEDESDSSKGSNLLFRPPSASQIYSAGSQFTLPPAQSQEQFQVSQFAPINPYQVSMQFPQYPSQALAASQVGSYYGNGYQLDETLKREREKVRVLEQELQEKEGETVALKRLQKKYNTLTTTCSEVIEQGLDEFFEDVLKQRLGEIDKAVKRSENRLKKLHLKLKDREQAQRSRRLIEEHRSKRSHSRSRREGSPRQNQNYNSLSNMPRVPNKRNNQSLSIPNDPPRSKQSEQSRSSQQFQEIATQYQEMIKSKTKEVEAYEVRLRQKEKELIEMTAKCAKLEIRVSDVSDSSKGRTRAGSEREENLLANLDYVPQKDSQILALNKRISQLEELLQGKQKELSLKDEKNNKKLAEYEAKIKKSDNEMIKLRQECRRLERQTKTDDSLQGVMKKLQGELQLRQKQFQQLKEKSSRHESEKVQRECQNLTLSNKLKKLESLLALKEDKVGELEKIIQSSVGGEGDLLEKSMYLQRIDQQDLHNLQADKEHLEEELARQREQIFLLEKGNEQLQAHCQQLEETTEAVRHEVESLQIQNQSMRITLKAQEFEKYRPEAPKQLLEEEECLSEQEEQRLRDELEDVRRRLEESQSMLKLQSQKTFEENRKALKLTSQLSYFREQLADREDRYERLRREHEQGKAQSALVVQQLHEREEDLEVQRRVNADKIHEIEAQWLQFQQEVRGNQQDLNTSRDPEQLRNSRHFSEDSFANYRTTYNSLSAENERLLERLKQAEKVAEVQKEMEDKIVGEYRTNVDKLKAELRDKAKESERNQEENEGLKRRIRLLEQSESRLKEQVRQSKDGDEMLLSTGSGSQRMVELQAETAQLRELNSRLSAVEQQLFGQLGMKEQQIEGLLRAMAAKERRIEQMEDIIQLKEMNFSSHISQSQHNKSKVRESLQSQSSLRYSMLSNANRDRTMELELSEAGESFFDQNQSIISNVSEVFGREEFPYEKMQLRRVEQRRLFEKTAAYIKSLKKAIEEKGKRIRLLQRKIDSLRNSQLIRKDIYQVREGGDSSDEDDFRDYLSVQVEQRGHSQRLRMRQLEHETKLTIEENNLLNNQIESLQEELMKAEEQENSLMKLKDLYKDQIKNLIKQNQDQAKLFEDQLKKERAKLEQADSIQMMEALKQIFAKIVPAVVAIENESAKSKRRDERRKELEDYLKVCCNLLAYDPPVREQLLSCLKEGRR